MLERTPGIVHDQVEPERHDESASRPYSGGLGSRAWQFFVHLSFSSLTRRIISLNLTSN